MKTSYSELDAYRQCRLKHQLGYIEKWKPAEEKEVFTLGHLWHQTLALHYGLLAEKYPFDNVVAEVGQSLYDHQTGESSEHQDLIAWMYSGYVEAYDSDHEWEFVGINEERLFTWMPSKSGGRSNVRLVGVLDLVVKWQGELWIVDHKSCKDLPSSREIDLDDQPGLYIHLLRRQGLPVRGAIMNYARKQRNKTKPQAIVDRFARHITYRTDTELDTMVQEARELAQEARRRREGDAPRSPNPDTCRWRCDFTEACLLGRKGLDMRQYLRDTGYIQNGV